MKKQGFTLVEVLVVVTIMGILSAVLPGILSRVASERKGEQSILTFWMELRSLQAKVMRYDTPIIVTFDINNNSYTIAMDDNKNGIIEEGESTLKSFSSSLAFGLSIPSPSALPPKVANYSVVNSNWSDPGLTIANNATLSINGGHIYIKNSHENRLGYVVVVGGNSSDIELYKWSGGQWYKM